VIECIPPEQLTYLVGTFRIVFGVNNKYETTKTCKILVAKCDTPECTTGTVVGESETFDLPPGMHNIAVDLTIEQSGYYAIIIYNVTDEKQECGFVIRVMTQMEQMMEMTMGLMPMMIAIPLVGGMISAVTKTVEEVGK